MTALNLCVRVRATPPLKANKNEKEQTVLFLCRTPGCVLAKLFVLVFSVLLGCIRNLLSPVLVVWIGVFLVFRVACRVN